MGILASLEMVVNVLSEIESVLSAVVELPAETLPAKLAADIAAVQSKLSTALALVHGVGL